MQQEAEEIRHSRVSGDTFELAYYGTHMLSLLCNVPRVRHSGLGTGRVTWERSSRLGGGRRLARSLAHCGTMNTVSKKKSLCLRVVCSPLSALRIPPELVHRSQALHFCGLETEF